MKLSNLIERIFGTQTKEDIKKLEIDSKLLELSILFDKLDSEELVELKCSMNNLVNKHISIRITNAEKELDILSVHNLIETEN